MRQFADGMIILVCTPVANTEYWKSCFPLVDGNASDFSTLSSHASPSQGVDNTCEEEDTHEGSYIHRHAIVCNRETSDGEVERYQHNRGRGHT